MSNEIEHSFDPTTFVPAPVDVLLGITYISASNKKVVAEMPITTRHTQPMGILHGGISVTIAESVGSTASNIANSVIHGSGTAMVGLEINSNHCKGAMVGDTVVAIATPLHIGKSSHVWNIDLTSKQHGYRICVARLTTHVVTLDPLKHKSEFITQKKASPLLPNTPPVPTPIAQPQPSTISTSPPKANLDSTTNSVHSLSSLKEGERIPIPACL